MVRKFTLKRQAEDHQANIDRIINSMPDEDVLKLANHIIEMNYFTDSSPATPLSRCSLSDSVNFREAYFDQCPTKLRVAMKISIVHVDTVRYVYKKLTCRRTLGKLSKEEICDFAEFVHQKGRLSYKDWSVEFDEFEEALTSKYPKFIIQHLTNFHPSQINAELREWRKEQSHAQA